jgi:hypothetical protein
MDRDEALAEIARRYFTSHGPATLSDFGWWSGLPAADARSGLEMARPGLQSERIEGAVYWRADSKNTALLRAFRIASHAALLPAYDEYTVAYRDRGAALDPAHAEVARNGIFSQTVLVKGRVAGTWTRQLPNGRVAVALKPFAPLSGASARAVTAAAEHYGRFLGRPVEIQ